MGSLKKSSRLNQEFKTAVDTSGKTYFAKKSCCDLFLLVASHLTGELRSLSPVAHSLWAPSVCREHRCGFALRQTRQWDKARGFSSDAWVSGEHLSSPGLRLGGPWHGAHMRPMKRESRGDVVHVGVEALRVGAGCHTSISLSSTRIGSFPTAVLLSEADMEQSFSWPKWPR